MLLLSPMRSFAHKKLPKPVRLGLRWLKKSAFIQPKKKMFYYWMRKKHRNMLRAVSQKEKIKVVFLAIHESVWKVDNVFKHMLEDDYFEPVILVCPYTSYGPERQEKDLDRTYNFFREKGYPVVSSKREDGGWLELEELKPDLLFFTNPHDLTFHNYYRCAYENYLSCYVPYFYLVTSHDGDDSIYNHYFHNAMWRIFMPHSVSLELARRISANKAANCTLTGYPACEPLLARKEISNHWKNLGNRKRVIVAPHHTIDGNEELNLSNFLVMAVFFKELVEKYKEKIQWCFKPHPILRSKLYNHPDWGKVRTDSYYEFWETGNLSQISEGEYESLFIHSDAMIHDCGSFLAEYLYLKKPVLYLLSEKTMENLNDFGKSALKCCSLGKRKADIIDFLDRLIGGDGVVASERELSLFFRENVDPYFANGTPSTRICDSLKYEIKGSNLL